MAGRRQGKGGHDAHVEQEDRRQQPLRPPQLPGPSRKSVENRDALHHLSVSTVTLREASYDWPLSRRFRNLATCFTGESRAAANPVPQFRAARGCCSWPAGSASTAMPCPALPLARSVCPPGPTPLRVPRSLLRVHKAPLMRRYCSHQSHHPVGPRT
jgi:hypothetical protein